MRKIREMLRLKFGVTPPLSNRQVAASCRVSPSTVSELMSRFKVCGLTWPLADEVGDETLEAQLYPEKPRPESKAVPTPDWAYVQKELRRKGVTEQLLWEEYRKEHPDGYSYSWFCHSYRQWRSLVDPAMRQTHRLGEKCFVDYAGQTVWVVTNPLTGEGRAAQVFVGALGASNYTYAEATWSQDLPNWLRSHVRMFAYFGGVSELIVPDNLRSGVTKADWYEPDINIAYAELAAHYGVAVVPTRVARPKDKAKVENAVLVAERWILAALRNRVFYSLDELNAAIGVLLEQLNDRPFQKLQGCRRSVFLEQEKPMLSPLPAEPFIYAQWKKARVGLDYHIDFEGHYYSVPHTLIHQLLDVRATSETVEMFSRQQRVAIHRRSDQQGQHTTLAEHMPPKHRKMREWSPERLAAWAAKAGPKTRAFVEELMASKAHELQGLRSCLGVVRLASKFGTDRVEAACERALRVRALTYKSVRSILEKNLDRLDDNGIQPQVPGAVHHRNVRGASYYRVHMFGDVATPAMEGEAS